MPHVPASSALSRFVVLDLTRVRSGPTCVRQLADFGADVIKIEPTPGSDPSTEIFGSRHDYEMQNLHRNKRSMTLNLKEARGREIFMKLVGRADVVVENYRPDVKARLGIDYESLRKVNPRIVLASLSGFGQDGPYVERGGFDQIAQGMSGIMSLTGEPTGEPQKMGVAFADIFTGVYGVIAVQAALAQRERTGLGQQVDMALLDVMVGVLANQAMNYLVSGAVPTRYGNAHPNIVPYQVCAVADGHVMLAVGNDGQFQRLCAVLTATDLATDARYTTNEGRVIHRAELVPALSAYLRRWTRDALLARLASVAVPAGPINTVADVFADPQVQYRGLQIEMTAPQVAGGTLPGVRTPIQFSGAALATGRPAPRLGEHNAEVRREYGF